ncbi:Clavaminate synthase-like protein [Rickenella mellea]|uniref:Clavaminate synthase-like protein n=1 Tax=Rickenella mellea TaxID=50990 RepID=A0A4Y7PWN6_9AGAM|nr:Clavaminate synthase-like protein [Rickenella mellea]
MRRFATFTVEKDGISIPSLEAVFPHVWLRDSCQCPSCVHPTSKQKLHKSTDIPLDIRPKATEDAVRTTKDPAGLHVEWSAKGIDEHHSFYPASFLQRNSSLEILRAFHREINRQPWPKTSTLDLSFPYEALSQPSHLLSAMTLLDLYGMIFVRDVPTTETSDEKCELRVLAEKFGQIRKTFYGETWDVRNVRNSKNIAYTNLHLGLHMDLLYFHNPPRYQALHCLRHRVEGGHSIFVDGLAAGLELYHTAEREFAELASTPVNFHYINDGHHLHSEHPTIEVRPEPLGGPDAAAIYCINYSPPFQAPLPPTTPPSFYAALNKFVKILEAPENRYECVLNEGEAVIFDNRRILHGRRSFADLELSGADGETNRWLKGCYLDEDAFQDKRRILDIQETEQEGS